MRPKFEAMKSKDEGLVELSSCRKRPGTTV